MPLRNRIRVITIVYQRVGYTVYYLRTESSNGLNYKVTVRDLVLREFTGSTFTISWLSETNEISFVVVGNIDMEIKCSIIKEIFRMEDQHSYV